VAITAQGDEQSRVRTAAAGFDLHLTKPIDPDRLAIVLADIVILRGDTSWCGEEEHAPVGASCGTSDSKIFTSADEFLGPRGHQ
jgi:DNA-binding response OmpR family regulator